MLREKLITSACAAAMMLTMSAAPARAQGGTMDSRTEFTFNLPVELPGVTLPPGTYVFRFVDATTGKKVMQVQAESVRFEPEDRCGGLRGQGDRDDEYSHGTKTLPPCV